jgi:PBSX family phage terminase large subunit
VIYRKLSKRQKLAMLWWNHSKFKDRDALICDGSVRSGKSVSMTVGFILWSMSRFQDQKFGICGKTIGSLRRNIVLNLRDWLPLDFQIMEKRAENKIIITANGHSNSYFLFGGTDESSYMLIQGITLAGVLLDEVALMPRSFVDQALARCSVTGSKFWFNCNPAGPEHWFYKEWVCKIKERNALHIHFTMGDNLALDPKIKARYEVMYTGVFYERYVRGLWVAAEGLVYPMFREALHTTEEHGDKGVFYLSLDYGTINPTAMGLWRILDGAATMEREYYHDSRKERRQKTDEEYYADLEQFVGDTPIERIIIDPSAASFKECIRRHGKFKVMDANNSVIDGIRFTGSLLNQGKVMIHKSCQNTIREFGAYLWDEKAKEDAVIKENDHSMDQMRYLFQTLRNRHFKERERKYTSLWMTD